MVKLKNTHAIEHKAIIKKKVDQYILPWKDIYNILSEGGKLQNTFIALCHFCEGMTQETFGIFFLFLI